MSDWPKKDGVCHMPELPKLSFNSLFLMIHRALAGGGPKSPKSSALVMNYVRLVDKAVIDYNNARVALQTFVSTSNDVVGPIFVVIGHLESCIETLVRAINFGRAIRKDGTMPGVVPRKLRVLSDTVYKPLNDFRNGIQHLDRDVLAGRIVPPNPMCLIVKDGGTTELLGMNMGLAEIADWIKELHELATALAYYREPKDESDAI